MEIKSLRELKDLFRDGALSKDDGDVIIFDKFKCELQTDKDLSFYMSYDDVAWEALQLFNIYASGV